VVQQRLRSRPNAVVDLYVHDVTTGHDSRRSGDQCRHLSGLRQTGLRRQTPMQREQRDQKTLDLLAADPG
jgi:hypothetical protein